MESELDIIQSVFTPDIFDVKETAVSHYIISDNKNRCLNIKINPDEIYVYRLDKCYFSGNNLLASLDTLAILLNRNKISLEDGSTIYTKCPGIEVSLKFLRLLTSGKSWYNSKGYISSNITEEERHNNLILSNTFEKNMNLVCEKKISEVTGKNKNIFISGIKRETKRIMKSAREMIDYTDKSTSEYIQDLYEFILNSDGESCNEYIIINNIISDLSILLLYDPHLTKTFGGKTPKTRRRKIKN